MLLGGSVSYSLGCSVSVLSETVSIDEIEFYNIFIRLFFFVFSSAFDRLLFLPPLVALMLISLALLITFLDQVCNLLIESSRGRICQRNDGRHDGRCAS